jgi:putative membrane protein
MSPAQGREGPAEAGLHIERTLLAWIRTATTLAAGGLVGAGVAGSHSGNGVAALPFLFAALCGAVLLARSGVRHRRVQRALHGDLPLDIRADAVLAWLGVLAVAAGALVFVLTSP